MTIPFSAKKRSTADSAKLREQGIIPAVVYGPKIENISIEIGLQDFNKIFSQSGTTTLISLDVDGKKTPVLVKDILEDPVTDFITHVDFYAPNLKEETTADVPLEFVGESLAIKDLKGILMETLREVEVKCLPQDIPSKIEVDITSLTAFEDRIYVKDLKVDSNVAITRDPEDVVAFVSEQKQKEEDLESEVIEDVDNVEKIEKVRKEEVPEEKKD